MGACRVNRVALSFIVSIVRSTLAVRQWASPGWGAVPYAVVGCAYGDSLEDLGRVGGILNTQEAPGVGGETRLVTSGL